MPVQVELSHVVDPVDRTLLLFKTFPEEGCVGHHPLVKVVLSASNVLVCCRGSFLDLHNVVCPLQHAEAFVRLVAVGNHPRHHLHRVLALLLDADARRSTQRVTFSAGRAVVADEQDIPILDELIAGGELKVEQGSHAGRPLREAAEGLDGGVNLLKVHGAVSGQGRSKTFVTCSVLALSHLDPPLSLLYDEAPDPLLVCPLVPVVEGAHHVCLTAVQVVWPGSSTSESLMGVSFQPDDRVVEHRPLLLALLLVRAHLELEQRLALAHALDDPAVRLLARLALLLVREIESSVERASRAALKADQSVERSSRWNLAF